ncbi:hypothetical protein [Solwaraspora sp. WMMD792]|uniref:hypothetical protein n=1 Tax=Solwaraspora sp. WMMD792 TaxID=3016099 RepID=UPI00241629EA|nr:hypothetical protein [Solwaraspora sp. WMMD792]MDG4775160.1 hypothetical protein [Solwaraspora sp. WMMD792]
MSEPVRGDLPVVRTVLTSLAASAAQRAAAELPRDTRLVHRRDEREELLAGRFVDSRTGLTPARRVGPFRTPGGVDVWYETFVAARRLQVREAGAAAPAFVVTQARPPTVQRTGTVVDIEAGTVWIRGDLFGGLPADAYAGLLVTGGTLTLGTATVSGDVVEVPAPLSAVLRLDPAPDPPPAGGVGGCHSAGTASTLPTSVTFRFKSGVVEIVGDPGAAKAWGQQFRFGPATGDWTFVEQLWTLALGYTAEPTTVDATPVGADPAGDPLIDFTGIGAVRDAGLGLPVVVVTDPTILGEASTAATWLLRVTGLAARWYAPDLREHPLESAWMVIGASAATVLADPVTPLASPVAHGIQLWAIAGGGGHRLPWRQTYDEPFRLYYRCHAVDGEHLMVTGRSEVALDRPVTTAGQPVPTPGGAGALLLHRRDGEITVLLGAAVPVDARSHHQFALRNALLWTTVPAFVYVRGTLAGSAGPTADGPLPVDNGTAQLAFGLHAWAPTLPDPYVSNGALDRPRIGREPPPAALVCRIVWTAPADVRVEFDGQLGPAVAVTGRPASPGTPQPPPKSSGPDIGFSQVEQGRIGLDKKTDAQWDSARRLELELRGQRIQAAARSDATSTSMVDGYLSEVVGQPPNLLLLDVSTNQDLLGVGLGVGPNHPDTEYAVAGLATRAEVGALRVTALPQVQWEPVRTLDTDQDIITLGWFPTPLASATDGGATSLGARSQRLVPVVPADAVAGTLDAFGDGTPVGMRTTFPFGLIAAVLVQPYDDGPRPADLLGLTRPEFGDARGGIQITARAEGGRPDDGGVSATFAGRMRQLINGVDLASGAPLGLSVLGSTADPSGSVETVFNTDMATDPRVPVTRIDLSGYGGSSFSDWNNPFAAFAEAAKVQFRVMIGRTALEVVKVNSVLHPWGIRVTRSVTVERRPGGGVIRRDSGWQPFTPGLFDYRYLDAGSIAVAPYVFDAGVFRGLFDVRNIRPAPGAEFGHGGARLVPYHFDADLALDGAAGTTPATGVLGWLQVEPSGAPAAPAALRALIEAQGPVGGPIDTVVDVGGSGLPMRAQRIEVGLADDAGTPVFVATVRGTPRLPRTGSWSMVVRPVVGAPAGGGEATAVADTRGTPLIRRYPVGYPANELPIGEPPLAGTPGEYRFADAADLLRPTDPATEYAFVQTTATHAFLFPRPVVPAPGVPRIESRHRPALADVLARSTSKGAFPPPPNTLETAPGALHLDVGAGGTLAFSAAVTFTNPPTALQLGGAPGHGSALRYDTATLRLEVTEDRWSADFAGLRVWTDVAGLAELTGSELHIVGGTDQRPQVAQLRSLLLAEIEQILQYLPFVGDRGVQGPIDLAAANAKHELKFETKLKVDLPDTVVPLGDYFKLSLAVAVSAGVSLTDGKAKGGASLGIALEGKIPVLSVGVAKVFVIVSGSVTFSIALVSGTVTSEKLELVAFAGVGVQGQIGPFKAYAFLGIGFVLVYDAIAGQTKYGGLVALEAGVDLKVVKVKIRAELRGLVYDDAGTTKCDYSGSVKIQVDLFLILSISASYQVTETAAL